MFVAAQKLHSRGCTRNTLIDLASFRLQFPFNAVQLAFEWELIADFLIHQAKHCHIPIALCKLEFTQGFHNGR